MFVVVGTIRTGRGQLIWRMVMKNPMTPEEQCQAVMNNAAGYDMQARYYNHTGGVWRDREPEFIGKPLNFAVNEYRRKPEMIRVIGNVYSTGVTAFHPDMESAIAAAEHSNAFVRHIRLVEDPTWTVPEPEEKNPWRPIVNGEWPECKPGDMIKMKYSDGAVGTWKASELDWADIVAIEWRYAEDEK